MAKKKLEDILAEHDKRKQMRSGFETMWQELIELYLPRRADIYTTTNHTQGKDRTKRIYDSTPGVCMVRLAAVLQAMLTNRETQWLQIATDDEELNEMPEVKSWLEKDLNAFRRSLDSSNFYSQANEMYLDLPIGQGVMFIEESNLSDRDFYFSTRHIKECYISYSDQDIVEHIDLVRSMTARQIMDRWNVKRKRIGISGAIPDAVKKAYKKDAESPFDVIQSVFPNPDFSPRSINVFKLAYQCAWICDGEEIDRGGYNEFPFIVVPWSKASGEDYGRGPCWDALADVKTLYAMRKTQIRVAEKIADPPLQVPKKGFSGTIKLTPGGLNYYDQTSRSRIEPIQIGAHFNVSLEMIKDLRERIQDHFFINQLQLIDSREMTAEEVRARTAENARILGPTFGRLNDEYLDPLVGRCLGILRRAGKLSPIPDVVIDAARRKGTQLRVKFVSPLAKAQVASEVQGIAHTAGTALEWAKVTGDPAILDNLDFDSGIRKVADLDGAPPDFVRDRKMVAVIRKQRADAADAQRQLDAAKQAAGVAKDVASTQSVVAETEGNA